MKIIILKNNLMFHKEIGFTNKMNEKTNFQCKWRILIQCVQSVFLLAVEGILVRKSLELKELISSQRFLQDIT